MALYDCNLDPPEEKHIRVCPDCGGEIYKGDTVYELEQGYFVCESCFRDSIDRVDTHTLADHFDISYMDAGDIT